MIWLKHNPITTMSATSKRGVPGNYCFEQRSFDTANGKHRVRYKCM